MYTEGVYRRLIERERSKYLGECEGSVSALDNDQDRFAAIDTNDNDARYHDCSLEVSRECLHVDILCAYILTTRVI
jgi:hypothetical protein